MNIPVNLLVAENVISAILLIVFILFFVGYFTWKVMTTAPATPPIPADDGGED